MIALYTSIDINLINYSITNLKPFINLETQLPNDIIIYNDKLIQLVKLVNLYLI